MRVTAFALIGAIVAVAASQSANAVTVPISSTVNASARAVFADQAGETIISDTGADSDSQGAALSPLAAVAEADVTLDRSGRTESIHVESRVSASFSDASNGVATIVRAWENQNVSNGGVGIGTGGIGLTQFAYRFTLTEDTDLDFTWESLIDGDSFGFGNQSLVFVERVIGPIVSFQSIPLVSSGMATIPLTGGGAFDTYDFIVRASAGAGGGLQNLTGEATLTVAFSLGELEAIAPEPASSTLGLLGLALLARRRRRPTCSPSP